MSIACELSATSSRFQRSKFATLSIVARSLSRKQRLQVALKTQAIIHLQPPQSTISTSHACRRQTCDEPGPVGPATMPVGASLAVGISVRSARSDATPVSAAWSVALSLCHRNHPTKPPLRSSACFEPREGAPRLGLRRGAVCVLRQALHNASCRTEMACATAARVACVALSGLSIMKSCVMPS
jgi:hypothetical protein